MKQVFIILDCLGFDGKGLVYKVVEHLNTFVLNRLTWGDNVPHYSHNQDGSFPINLSTDQMEDYWKVFYMTFNDPDGKRVYRVERRNIY